MLAYPEERDHTPSGMPYKHVYHISIFLPKVGDDNLEISDVIREVAVLPCPRCFMIASVETLSSKASGRGVSERTESRTGTSLWADVGQGASGKDSLYDCTMCGNGSQIIIGLMVLLESAHPIEPWRI